MAQKKESAKTREYETLINSVAIGVSAPAREVREVNEQLARLLASLEKVKNRGAKDNLTQMCIATLSGEIEPEEEEEPSYIG